ncbi:MAG: PilZ domain-containing protein [Planctomycetota bacterium]|jgi:hypothetical protein
MMNGIERRKYRRLPVRLKASCSRVNSVAAQLYCAHTVDVSPAGLLFEVAADVFEVGNLIAVEMFVPPTAGLLEQGGRMSGLARVVRIENTAGREGFWAGNCGVAVEFCSSPRLST